MPSVFQLGLGTVVRFQGADRCKVFNNLCTQDLRKLADGQAFETFVTDGKGRTFGHGIALSVHGEAYFVTVPDQGSKLVPHFDRYIIREDATLTDMSSDFQFWLFADRASAAAAFAVEIEKVPVAWNATSIAFEGRDTLLLSAPWIGPDSIVGLVPTVCNPAAILLRLGDALVQSDMTHRSAWDWNRIAAFWPWYGVDVDDRHLPQEVDRDKTAISFNKGCYLGQETIARLDMLGKIQKKLVRLAVQSNACPSAATPVYAQDKEVGSVCSAASPPANGNVLALAYIKRSHFASGQELLLNGCTATVL